MNRKLGIITLSSSMFIFGTIGLVRRFIPDSFSSGFLSLCRGALGFIILLSVLLFSKKKIEIKKYGLNNLFVILAGAMLGMNWMFLFEAYNYTTVANATLGYYMAPVFVMILSPFVFGEKLTIKKTICIAVAVFGMVLVSGILINRPSESGNLKGILFSLIAAMFYTGIVIFNKKSTSVPVMQKTAIELFVSFAVMLVYVSLSGSFPSEGGSVLIWLMVLVAGVIHTGLAYLLYFSSMPHLSSQSIALLSYIDPATAILISWIILRDDTSAGEIIGAVLIIFATLISEIPFGKRKERP